MNELITKNPPARQAPEGACPHAPRILFADDEPGIRFCCSIALSRAGYNVTTVTDGQEVWKALKTKTFDLLVTDNQMPNLAGQDLVLKMRQHGLKLPIIVAASDLEFFLNPENGWLQVAQLLQKPFDLQQLMEAVTRCVPVGH